MRRLGLGLLLIGLSSSVLLVSDWRQRRASGGRVKRVAVVQHASQPLLDEGVAGMLDALAEAGFVEGQTLAVQRFNAENDLPMANAIARQVTGGDYHLLLTASTLSLQTVANANRAGRTPHVFGLVADPPGAGVAISRENPLDHPKHLTGLGSLIPVDRAFELARRLNPGLRRVGVAWNPGESNSASFLKAARQAAAALGLELVEANVENSAAVGEVTASLVARGVDAMWVGGDITVMTGLEAVVAQARKGRIPVFSILPPAVKRGTLFDLGANFYEVGRQTGQLAARVLSGADPAQIPVSNLIPERLAVSRTALAGLRDPWRIPDEVLARAEVVVDETGVREKQARVRRPTPGRTYRVGLAYFAPDVMLELVFRGLHDGFREMGFETGRNLELRQSHAQGEMVNIPQILTNYDSQDLDLIMTWTTPVLTAACNTVKSKRLVFTLVSDPIAAGAGRSATDHLPFLTGVGMFPPVSEMIELIQDVIPGVRSVGTLYNDAEANSRKVVSVGRELFRKRGLRLEEVTVTAIGEVHQAAQVLAARNIQAFWISGDNTADGALDSILQVAQDRRLPVFLEDPDFIKRGALAGLGKGSYEAGYAGARLAARVLLGENPRDLPFEEVSKVILSVNEDAAKRLGIRFPEKVLKAAKR